MARVGDSDDPRPKRAARWPTLLADGRRQSQGAQRGWRSCNSSGTALSTAQAEGWKAAVLKLEEKLKKASSALTSGRTPAHSPES